MTFADPHLLLLLLFLPLLLLFKRRAGDGSADGRFSNVGLLAGFRPTWRLKYRWLLTLLRTAAIVLLVVALARPQTGRVDAETPGQGIDIALVLDTSGSMAIRMGQDTRLQVSQRVLSDFIEERTNDRIGLVIFRSVSLVLSPMTVEYDALVDVVQRVNEVNLPDGTAIGVGLSDALNLLRDSRAPSRVVILLTDGENNAGAIEPLQAARIAETLGVRVYVIGVLDVGARGRGQLNVDEVALQEMASITGGRYFPAEDERALSEIYSSIDELEKARIERPQYDIFNEHAVYFLAAALGLMLAELGLRGTVWRQAT